MRNHFENFDHTKTKKIESRAQILHLNNKQETKKAIRV